MLSHYKTYYFNKLNNLNYIKFLKKDFPYNFNVKFDPFNLNLTLSVMAYCGII